MSEETYDHVFRTCSQPHLSQCQMDSDTFLKQLSTMPNDLAQRLIPEVLQQVSTPEGHRIRLGKWSALQLANCLAYSRPPTRWRQLKWFSSTHPARVETSETYGGSCKPSHCRPGLATVLPTEILTIHPRPVVAFKKYVMESVWDMSSECAPSGRKHNSRRSKS